MSFAEINGKQVQVESLEGVMQIRLECEDLELTIETDSELRDMLQLISGGGDRAPSLRRDGAILQVKQHGRYRNTVILRLPAAGLPPLNGSHVKGDLTVERVNGEITLQHGVGAVRVERGSGDLTIDNGKGDVAVRDRVGALTLRTGSGNVNVQRCQGAILINTGKGDVHAVECDGELRTQTGSGNVQVTSGSGHFIAKTGSGDIYVNRPLEQCLSLNTASGNVLVRDGTVVGLAIAVSRGDISSSARLQLPPEGAVEDLAAAFEAANIDLEGLEQRISRAVEESINRSGAHFVMNDLAFEAGDSGMRITRGGVPVFEADDRGLRFKKGNFSFEAGDTGVRIKRGSAAGQGPIPPGTFELETHSGNIMLDVPYGAPMRVEALVTSGEVRSDVPLVTVGRPGPRGSTQRFVGGTTPGTEPRMSLRLKTDRGDIRVRAVHTVVPPAPPRPPTPPDPPRMIETTSRVGPDDPTTRVQVEQPPAPEPRELSEREERMQTILESLASGSLSVAEAERLLRALDEQR